MLYFAGIENGIRGCMDIVHESRDVYYPADAFEIPLGLQRVLQSKGVYRLPFGVERDHGLEEPPVRVAIEVVGYERLDHFIGDIVVEQYRAENRLFRLDAVGQNALVNNPYTAWISGFHGVEHDILEIEPRRWGSPRSKLAELVLFGHPDKDGNPQLELSPDEKQRIITWIDLNVPFYGSFAQAVDDMQKTTFIDERR